MARGTGRGVDSLAQPFGRLIRSLASNTVYEESLCRTFSVEDIGQWIDFGATGRCRDDRPVVPSSTGRIKMHSEVGYNTPGRAARTQGVPSRGPIPQQSVSEQSRRCLGTHPSHAPVLHFACLSSRTASRPRPARGKTRGRPIPGTSSLGKRSARGSVPPSGPESKRRWNVWFENSTLLPDVTFVTRRRSIDGRPP